MLDAVLSMTLGLPQGEAEGFIRERLREMERIPVDRELRAGKAGE